ncbi:MAG: hypothetical protein VB858_15975 [Planctomycetaceae bacterium]
MSRIFLTLSSFATLALCIAFVLGLNVDDPKLAAEASAVDQHILFGLGGMLFATLVHAIVFTYFMGTGRWLEETSKAYQLPVDFHEENRKLKFNLLLRITACLLLLIMTGALGGAADPASRLTFAETFGSSDANLHLAGAVVTILFNLQTSFVQFRSIERNGEIIEEVLGEVQRIRTEKGLPV